MVGTVFSRAQLPALSSVLARCGTDVASAPLVKSSDVATARTSTWERIEEDGMCLIQVV